MKENNPNPKLVAAIQEAEQSKARITEAVNPVTAERIKLLIDLRQKLMKGNRNADGLVTYKLSGDEAVILWALCGTSIARYENGTDHICEFEQGSSNCIACGQLF